jgi:hypothetical protein
VVQSHLKNLLHNRSPKQLGMKLLLLEIVENKLHLPIVKEEKMI